MSAEHIIQKQIEITSRKKTRPIPELESSRFFHRQPLSLRKSLLDVTKTGIIAEFIRRSPDHGWINYHDSVESITRFYTAYSASALAIHTDHTLYGGSLDDLVSARDNDLPVLRNDLILDAYQIIESKAFGADAVLLKAEHLSPEKTKELVEVANGLGLEVVLEISGEEHMDQIQHTDLIGISINNTQVVAEPTQITSWAEKLGNNVIRIALSGIRTPADIQYLAQHGFKGFLMGEIFMKQDDPGRAFKEFTYSL